MAQDKKAPGKIEATEGRDFWSDPRVVEAATLAVPLALDFAGRKLAEAYQKFRARYEDKTGGDFDAVEPSEEQLANSQAFIDHVPADAEGFDDALRQRLVDGGAKVTCILKNDTIRWEGKGLDALQISHAREQLGKLTLDLSDATLTNADLSGIPPLTGVDLSDIPPPSGADLSSIPPLSGNIGGIPPLSGDLTGVDLRDPPSYGEGVDFSKMPDPKTARFRKANFADAEFAKTHGPAGDDLSSLRMALGSGNGSSAPSRKAKDAKKRPDPAAPSPFRTRKP